MENLRSWSEKAHRNSTKQGSLSERRQMGFKEYHRAKAKKMDVQVRSKMKRLEAELEKIKLKSLLRIRLYSLNLMLQGRGENGFLKQKVFRNHLQDAL